jgi:microcystin-dependent protein
MNDSFIGTVWMFGGSFAIINMAFCDGSTQSIAANQALFTLLGTTYGGDGITSFGLPDLRGRMVIGAGAGLGLSTYVLGQKSGVENVTLTNNTMPAHTHTVNVGTNATTATPSGSVYLNQMTAGGTAQAVYSDAAPGAALSPLSVSNTGNSIPFSILQPINTISYLITMFGIYPTSN